MKKLDSFSKLFWCLMATMVFTTGNLLAQPANDNCDGASITAVTIDGPASTVSGDATGATDGAAIGAAQAWEAFTLDGCADVAIDFCDSPTLNADNAFIILTQCPAVEPFIFGAATADCPNGAFTVNWSAVPAGTYYYPVLADAGFGGGDGPYTINITAVACPEAPDNDDACDAMMVAVGDTTSTTNTGATGEGIVGSCFGGSLVENDVWFSFVAPGGFIEVESIATGEFVDTQVAIYSSDDGTCTGNLTEEGCSEDIDGTNFMSFVSVALDAGETYWIQVDSWDGQSGDFDLAVRSAPPPNDDFCNATPLLMNDTASTANTGATEDGPTGPCWTGTPGEVDVWYSFVAPGNGMVTVETIDTGDNNDTQVAVYSSSDGTCAGDTATVGCSEDISGTDFMSFVELTGLVAGDTYFIQVDGWQGTSGAFDIALSSPPIAGDDICDAIGLTVDGGPVTADNTDGEANPDGLQGACFDDAATDDIWFSFVGPAGGSVEVETIDIGDNTDTQMAVYSSSDGTCAGDLTELGCNEDIDLDGGDYMSLVTVDGLTEGTTYFVQVDGWGAAGTVGAFDIEVRTVVAPGFCDGSTAIICDDIDTYTLGSIDGQAAHWAPWTPGSTDVAEVVDNISFSGSQSLRVGPGGTEDNLLLLGDQDMGVWTVDWKMYVPADSTAFFNIQADPTPGQAFIFQAFCNEDGGAPGVGTFQGLAETFTYPEDAWFDVSILVDMNNLVHSLSIDGVLVLDELPYVSNAGPADATTLSSINFYSIDAENTYYLDNVVFDGNPNVGVSEYVQDLYTVFPNPTEGMVTVQGEQNIEGIVVRDMLGAVVLKVASPYANRVELDMSSLENGVYFLEVQVDSQININRVVKN